MVHEHDEVDLNPLPQSSQNKFRLDLCSEDDRVFATEVLIEEPSEAFCELNLQQEFYFTDMFKSSPCIAHILQLVLVDGLSLDEMAKMIDKIIRRLSAFCRNRQMIRKVTKAIEGRVLTQPVITRWNSVVDCGELLYEVGLMIIVHNDFLHNL